MSGAPADVLAPWVETTPGRCRDEHDIWCNRVGTDRRIDAARLQFFQELLGCVSGTAQTPEVTSHLVRPKRQGANGYRYYARRDRLRRLEPLDRPARRPIRRMN